MSAVAIRTRLSRDTSRLSELLHSLGDIPAERIRRTPFPGTATEADVVYLNETKEEALYELVDGTLVAKDMSFYPARVGLTLCQKINIFVDENDLGLVFPADAMMRFGKQIRLPDIAFISWDRFPKRKMPRGNILNVGIDLAVEVLSAGNRPGEMLRKRQEYFANGVRQVWEVDPEQQTIRIYTGVNRFRELGPDDTLDGGKILPGFSLPIAKLFADAGPREKE